MADQAEDFTRESLSGDPVSLADHLTGNKGVVVVFWSGVCSHCQRYDGYLNAFAEEHPEIGLLVVACREGESADDVRQVAQERGLRFQICVDPGRTLALEWKTHQTPRVFLISSTLEVLYRGAIDNFSYATDPDYAPYLEAALADHLAGRPIGRSETPSFGCAVQSIYYETSEP